MRRVCFTPLVLCAVLAALSAAPAFAVITAIGDVTGIGLAGDGSTVLPDPNQWDNTTTAYIGNTIGDGWVTVDTGSVLQSGDAFLGFTSGLTGTVTISNGAAFNLGGDGHVGNGGTGTLVVTGTGTTLGQDSSKTFYVGDGGGTGTFTVSSGAYATTAILSVAGQGNGGSGTVNVDGATVNVAGSSYYFNLSVGGQGQTGVINVTNGGKLYSNTNPNYSSSLGVGGNGTINVVGAGSEADFAVLTIGASGTGALNVRAGGTLSTGTSYNVGASDQNGNSGTGSLTVDGAGSSFSPPTDGFIGSPSGGKGTITISNGAAFNIGGNVLHVGSGGTGTLVITGTGTTFHQDNSSSNSQIYVGGGGGTGTFTVSNGAYAYTAIVTVAGQSDGGSGTLNVNGGTLEMHPYEGAFDIGGQGQTGVVNVTNGGQLYSGDGVTTNLGAGGNGIMNVIGAGSEFSSNGNLMIGNGGTGTLNIRGGGQVSVGTYVSSGSLLSIDVGHGSSCSPPTNDGTVRIVAAANVANGTYTPIAAGGGGSGTYQAVGGKWNSSTYQFTVTSAVTGTAGHAVSITPSGANQRVLISDSATQTSTGIGFLSTESALTVTGSTLTGAPLSDLTGQLPAGQGVLDGWTYSTTGGYVAGDPAYLSLSLAGAYSGYSRDDLSVWSYDGSAWSQLTANDLSFDGTYASFTATALNGYDYAIVGIPLVRHPGDANGDGTVNINDLSVVLANYDKTGMSWSQGDFTGDGTVDIGDLSIILANYDKKFTAGGIKAVPEPSAIALLAAGLVGLLAYGWRKQR
jgi:T5SS/PEP-CTERM-associated repeat protein